MLWGHIRRNIQLQAKLMVAGLTGYHWALKTEEYGNFKRSTGMRTMNVGQGFSLAKAWVCEN